MIRVTAVFLVAIFFAGLAVGQKSIETKSGQSINILANGSWEVTEKNVQSVEKETDDLSPFIIPSERNVNITRAQLANVNYLISELELVEAKFAVAIFNGNRYIQSLEDKKTKTIKEDQGRFQSLIKEQKTQDKATTKAYNLAARYIKKLRKLTVYEGNKASEKLAELEDDIVDDFNIVGISDDQVASSVADRTPDSYPTSFEIDDNRGPRNPFICEVTFDGKDPVTGKSKKEISGSELFTFTQEKAKPFLKEEHFMTCESVMTKVGKNYYLTLNFRIKSKDAIRSYGSLDANEEMRIEFIDGEKVFGLNIVQGNGSIEPYSGHTIYTAVYKLEDEAVNQLSKKLVDNIGVLWSSGFEQYDVYNVDLLQEQINCLKNG